jgi:hypothetical protein
MDKYAIGNQNFIACLPGLEYTVFRTWMETPK